MVENLERTMNFILSPAIEGDKITNDPLDRGGLTAAYGLTLTTMKALRIDLDGDGDVDAADVGLVSRDVAIEAFREHYWDLIDGDDLEGGFDLILADVAWNSGPGKARQFIKEGYDTIEDLTERRKIFYNNIVKRNPTQRRFLKGWLRRADLAYKEALKCEV